METSTPYLPNLIFAPPSRAPLRPPRVFVSPQRYVQGEHVLRDLGRHLSLLPAKRAGLLMSARGRRGEGEQIIEGLETEGVAHITSLFRGECSLAEIDHHTVRLAEEGIDCLIAAGGGKCIDAGKAIAFRLGVPVVVAPTLASNDAPCSAVSVLYSAEGISTGAEFYPCNPAFVVVDTAIVARAPERYLVAGMGDAMATWYEARVCLLNPAARTTVGARPTIASAAIGEACARTLFEQGAAAAAAVADQKVDDALEAVVEANTLLSGLGFESGGLAAAHAVAQSYTRIPKVEANHLHGEMVAMGTLTQLVMEARPEEAMRVTELFATVGLPVHLGQVSLDPADATVLDTIVAGTLAFPFIQNMPFEVDADRVRSAVLEADALGRATAGKIGDVAYRRLHQDQLEPAGAQSPTRPSSPAS